RKTAVPTSRLGQSLDGLRFLLEKGARWTPDARSIVDARRALYRVDGDAIVLVVDLLRTHQASDEAVLKTLVSTEKMRGLLSAADRRRTAAERRVRPTVSLQMPREKSSSRAGTAPTRHHYSRYDRERL